MTLILKANSEDFKIIADIGRISFLESHGKSASEKEINTYVKGNYNDETIIDELADHKNIYYIIYHHNQPAGYSKILLKLSHENIPEKNVTKLERIYLLSKFYDLKLGLELLNFNISLSKVNNQAGMWLFVWQKNQRAIKFYEKIKFNIIGNYNFKITESHSNPNYQMFLKY